MSADSFLSPAPAGRVSAVQIHDPVDPAAYSLWVPVVGAVLLVLIVGWLAWVFWYTRKRPFTEEKGRGDRFEDLRAGSLADIASAEERYRSGEADLRALHLDLNHIMREFANGRLRMDTSSLTVAELTKLEGTDRLTRLLADYEEPAFAIDSDAEALAATRNARAVVEQW